MPSVLFPLVILSLRNPRSGMALVLNMPWGDQGRWCLFGLATICPAIVLVLSFALDPNMTTVMGGGLSPFAILGVQALAILLFAWLTHVVGRWRGGRGTFPESLLTLSWLQLCLVPVQFFILALDFVSSDVASMVGTIFMLWTICMLTSFVCELHGFKSPALVLLGIFGTMFLLVLVLSVLAAFVMGPPNV